jgi:hypothetical protein
MLSVTNRKELKLSLAWACTLAVAALFALPARSETKDATAQTITIKNDPTSLCEIVARREVMVVTYNYDPAGVPIRVVHPYAVGYTRHEDVLLFGRQVEGYSKSAANGSDEIPGWRNFRTDKITFMAERGDLFEPIPAPPTEYRAIQNFICKVKSAFGG